jgi:hypothetical protein
MEDWPVPDRRVLEVRRSKRIAGLTVESFSVEHPTKAPTVGYRLSAGRAVVFYVPDLVYIHERKEALNGAQLCIGDGAAGLAATRGGTPGAASARSDPREDAAHHGRLVPRGPASMPFHPRKCPAPRS